MESETRTALSEHPAILVVGAGPAGLVTALTLRKNNVPVRIIDRATEPHQGIRGTFIQPRSLELFASLRILDDFQRVATPPYQIAAHAAGKAITAEIPWAEEADDVPGIPYRLGANISQSVLERILREHLARYGTAVRMGVELVKIEQTEETVTVHLSENGNTRTEEYAYVVAANGAKGNVRKDLGVSFLGESKESEAIFIANIECSDIDRVHWHRWGDFKEVMFFMKPVWPAPLFQGQAIGPALPKPLPSDTEGIQAFFNGVSKSDEIKFGNAACMTEWRSNIRMADKFQVGRVFLVGDCAHCHSPAGGQGMNSAMLDGLNIAWKLALVHKRLAARALLDTYAAERMPVIAEMLSLTKELHARVAQPGKAGSASALGADPSAAQAADPMWRPKTVTQLGVNCRWSRIVMDGRGGGDGPGEGARGSLSAYGMVGDGLRAGDRAPDVPLLRETPGGGETTLFEVLAGCAEHTILVFGAGEVQRLVDALRPYREKGVASVAVVGPKGAAMHAVEGARIFEDGGHAYTGYEVDPESPAFVVVRPDGMIGAFATDLDQVHKYFATLLG
ncbi:FAD/NAD(P)-binding domain-containing protein [Dentipellis sp. KUC8613]|nr:FAD/NAD(P)-binding domain-containing protein [Dentipellis sp. KUC8613]